MKIKGSMGTNAKTGRQKERRSEGDENSSRALMWASAGPCVAGTRQACRGKGISTAARALVSPPELLLPPRASKTRTCILKRPEFTPVCVLQPSCCATLTCARGSSLRGPVLSFQWVSIATNKNHKCKFVHYCGWL